ncbi:hypothetical protein [Exiguobacterium sp. s133]|uniref:hypothetical protein n=1 Tax=Exiguobacterium sp. s133 TaxID=2751213 RepID=UPI001BE983C3|nr:hypothetical protein [Exiguobacterium sp. s133]
MEIAMDKKVKVENLCAWPVYFARQIGNGDVKIAKGAVTLLTVEEIQAQVFSGNRQFTGVDGSGTNARLFIQDADVRQFLDFETKEKPQKVMTEKEIKAILALKTQDKFEEKINDNIKTEAEKTKLLEVAQKVKLNDYDKIQFVEEYTGKSFQLKVQ